MKAGKFFTGLSFSLNSIDTELKTARSILREVIGDLKGTEFCSENSFIGLITTKV
jgi:hypothetical protein